MPALSKDEQAVAVVVTRKELIHLRDAENALAVASQAHTLAENAVKPLRIALAEKVLGTKTEAEYRAFDPDKIEAIVKSRMKRNLFEIVRGAPSFSFEKTASGRYVAWKQAFIAEMGETAAARRIADEPTTYSYRIHVE